MTNFLLIRRIKQLKKVKPRKDWVLLTKKDILGEDTTSEPFLFLKPAYVGLFTLLFFFGLIEFSQNALPGESLYYVKKAAERSQRMLSAEEEKPRLSLESANKRLEELSEVAQKSGVKKLATAMDELQISVAEAAKDLVKIKKIDEETIVQVKRMEELKEDVEQVLAVKIETSEYEEYDNALAQLVEGLILDLENSTLNEEKRESLEQAKQDFENEEYSEALTKILESQ